MVIKDYNKMKKLTKTILLISTILITGCLTQRSITTPITYKTQNYNYTAEQIGGIIEYSLDMKNWKLDKIYPDKNIILASYSWGAHTATVKVTYSADSYTIDYYSSIALNYRKSKWSNNMSIHGKFNTHINTFNKYLQDNLKHPETTLKEVAKMKEYQKYLALEKEREERARLEYLNRWLGKKVSDLMEEEGPPLKTVKNGDRGEILVYQVKITKQSSVINHNQRISGLSLTSYSNELGLAIGGSRNKLTGTSTITPERSYVHLKYYYVDKTGIIYKWKNDIKEI